MWTLVDAELQALTHPDTFQIPLVDARENLKPGQHVTLIFQDGEGDERMWVRVTGHDGDGYLGILVNNPVTTDEIEYGSPIPFDARHVIAIGTAEDAEGEVSRGAQR